MPQADINLYAVIIAAIVHGGLGVAWYSPGVFGKRLDPPTKKISDKHELGRVLAVRLGFSLLTIYVMAHFIAYAGAIGFWEGVQVGFWLWLGLVATTEGVKDFLKGRSLRLFLIDQGYYLLALVAAGAMLAAWR